MLTWAKKTPGKTLSEVPQNSSLADAQVVTLLSQHHYIDDFYFANGCTCPVCG
jgi:hypothetical protein